MAAALDYGVDPGPAGLPPPFQHPARTFTAEEFAGFSIDKDGNLFYQDRPLGGLILPKFNYPKDGLFGELHRSERSGSLDVVTPIRLTALRNEAAVAKDLLQVAYERRDGWGAVWAWLTRADHTPPQYLLLAPASIGDGKVTAWHYSTWDTEGSLESLGVGEELADVGGGLQDTLGGLLDWDKGEYFGLPPRFRAQFEARFGGHWNTLGDAFASAAEAFASLARWLGSHFRRIVDAVAPLVPLFLGIAGAAATMFVVDKLRRRP